MLKGFWKEATRAQRNAFLAAWLGWILDAFDFTLFLLVMPAVGAELHLDRTALAEVVTATLLGRVLGGPLGGWLCDRYGRRRPMMVSLVLYAAFDVMVAFAGSHLELLLYRFLFGIGMGTEWSAGTALAMEHWPRRTRGLASGLLQGSWAIGYFFAALAYWIVVPSFGWRPLFFLAGVPALLAIFVRARVEESPSWTAVGAARGDTGAVASGGAAVAERPAILTLFMDPVLRRALIVGSTVLGGGFFVYYALATFYPTLLAERGLARSLPWLVMLFNAGMLAGSVICGLLSERIGRRGAIALFGGATTLATALYLFPASLPWLAVGAFVGGFVGVGWTGATPSYLAEQFPTRMRGAGVGTAYHLGALVGAAAPIVVPRLGAHGLPLAPAMAASACAGAVVVATAVWLSPERRGADL